jgi:hypothetical protein
VAFDRVWIERRAAGATLEANGETFAVSGALPARSGPVSARGRFVDAHAIALDAVHEHGGVRRDVASYVGLALVAALWLRPGKGRG